MSRSNREKMPLRKRFARLFDPVTLSLLRAAVEERSLAQAAETEGIAISAASRRIIELEARLGTALLRRHDRGVSPTAAGEALMTHLTSLFDLFEKIGSDMEAFASGSRGHVRLQANMSAVSGFLPEALAGFLPRHPDIQITLEERYTTDIVHSVRTGGADIGLLSGTAPIEGLHLRPWREDRLMVVLPKQHPLLAKSSLRLKDLDGVPFVGQLAQTALQKLYRQQAELADVDLVEQVNVSGFDGVRRMVEAGLGVAILPSTVCVPYASMLQIELRPLDEAWAVRPLVLCTRDPQVWSAATRLLVEHLTQGADRPATAAT